MNKYKSKGVERYIGRGYCYRCFELYMVTLLGNMGHIREEEEEEEERLGGGGGGWWRIPPWSGVL